MPDEARERRWPSSVRARLTLGYMLALALPLAALAVGSYVVLDRALLDGADHFLDEALSAFSGELDAEESEMPTTATAIRAALQDVRFRDLQLVVLDTAAKFVATGATIGRGLGVRAYSGSGYVPLEVRRLSDSLREYRHIDRPVLTIMDEDGGYRIHAGYDWVNGEPFLVAGAYPLHEIRATMRSVARTYLVGVPLLIAVAAVAGFQLAGRNLSPIAAMGTRAAEISASTLHERLPVADPGDEFGRLATVVNALLDRLEQAFAQQRRFMADASHELRTPVSIVRTESEVTLARDHRDEHEYRESVEVMRNAALRLGRIVEDLFLLARADAGQLTARRDQLCLAEVVQDAARGVNGIANLRGVGVEVSTVIDAPFRGDADLLSRLLLNLLDNAIKHSPPGGVVTVALADGASETPSYEISVIDNGPGLSPEAQHRVFERFFRVDSARSRLEASATAGAGLGLAIARWTAEAHGGRLEMIASRPGRTEFRATLPVDQSEPRAA